MSETVVEEAAAARKQTLRDELTARRKAMTPDLIDTRGLKVQSRFLATKYYEKARYVALYAPIKGEVPTQDILKAALQDGKVVCYPLSHVHGRILSFRAIKSELELEPGRLGVREPTNASDLIAVEQIDLFVVPGLGFTEDGKRLGRGGGYYDATLRAASPRSRRVGLAFKEQLVSVLPTTGDDVDMDLVVTESEVYRGLHREPEFLDT
ncbi:5-formyltetrahydrofolate cyclo-ligase [Myxococcus fulvus]|uniref:5-formyltetrahydrofolate cyclo-ligase n=1 Tax=Myxococcus fulvus TaxID=33 RepID=A0A511T800_MYXFU|nr:5-formyltetrahydrofolate cyclo-ligase [Myxococcus fulvus]AKF81191.1 5,10-methenyltetrahydrofolate synthetase [Myxococcus fulvus 124B02]GEN09448.1 5-formyltetrahydrofolate cyclo-ligase [Myxococcus fulvus]SEU32267.1 5-formyltetrahydrofolate cyclo-ligase [Myxococcus fulvus]